MESKPTFAVPAGSNADDDAMSIEEVARFWGGSGRPVHRATVWRWVRDGVIPPPYAAGPKTRRFSRAEQLAARAAAMARRPAKQPQPEAA